jgi:hypothetical protein
MLKALFVGAALAASLVVTVPAGAETSPDALAAAKPGMVVTDAAGKRVGKVMKVTRDAHGEVSVVITVDGIPVSLGASVLSVNPAGDGLVSSMTRAQIEAATGHG